MPEPPKKGAERLHSWKAIAAYLHRDVTTVQRWEKRESLGVHRHFHRRQGSVYAFCEELDVWVRRRSSAPAAAPRPASPAAYDAYLEAKKLSARYALDDVSKAIAYLKAAVQRDPRFAPAWAELARCYGAIAFMGYLPASDLYANELEAAQRAVEMGDSAEAHTVLGTAAFYHAWDWPRAERAFLRAIEIDPNHAEAHQFYAWFLAAVGRMNDATREVDAAVRLDPLNASIRLTGSTIHAFAGRCGPAIAEAQKALSIDPRHLIARIYLGWTRVLAGDPLRALDEFRAAASAAPQDPYAAAMLAYGCAAAGLAREATEQIEGVVDMSRSRYVQPYHLAVASAAIGDSPRAIAFLLKAFEERANWLVWLKVDQRLDGLRSQPVFGRLMARMNFPAAPSL